MSNYAVHLQNQSAEQSARIAALEAEVAKWRWKVKNLASSEAFTVGGVIDPQRDAELLARIEYARAALEGSAP